MSALPTVEFDSNLGDRFKSEVSTAFINKGVFQLKAPELISSGEEMLNRAKELFERLESEKSEILLDRESNFSGYSVLKNERDYREQYHLFSNFLSKEKTGSIFTKLKLPNRVPSVLQKSWLVSVNDYMNSMADISKLLLKALNFDRNDIESLVASCSPGPESYCLLKMIHYPPVPDSNLNRSGTPPHIDWSLVTIVMQDKEPGLSVMIDDDGTWIDVEIQDDCFIVLAGELLSLASRNLVRACPHKVILPDSVEQRISVPYFYSPDLDKDLKVMQSDSGANFKEEKREHIHQVFEPGTVCGDFHFGATELNRKLSGRWCYRKSCC